MRSPISSPNAISPEIMTAAERLDEIGAILAAGILRLRRQQNVNRGDRFRQRVPSTSEIEKRRSPSSSGRP